MLIKNVFTGCHCSSTYPKYKNSRRSDLHLVLRDAEIATSKIREREEKEKNG